MLRAFQEGGAMMYAVLAFDLCAATAFVVAFALALAAWRGSGLTGLARGAAVALLLVAFAPAIAGGVGYTLGMQGVERAVAAADAEFRERLLEAGQREAMNNVWFGSASSLVCLVASSVVVAIAFFAAAPKRGDEPTSS